MKCNFVQNVKYNILANGLILISFKAITFFKEHFCF